VFFGEEVWGLVGDGVVGVLERRVVVVYVVSDG
jgi:hypothetical protein